MFKKLLSTVVFTFLMVGTYAQTIVNTDPENKKVILEEFTGIHCVYCPSGHTIAQSIQDNNPGDVFLINVHVGSFAVPSAGQPDFRTPYGSAIAGQSGLTGYPSGTINRHVFSGGTTAMGRGQWTSAANETLGESSYVNLAVEADIDVATNTMNIHVEAYYTGDSPESTNLLNVAIIQNNTLGPQTGGGQGDNYNHMHRLVDMVTGQWGEEVTQTTQGSFIDRNYTYSILPENNYVPVELDDLEIVVFMAETHQEIISGNGTTPTYTVTNADDANLRYVERFQSDCLSANKTITPSVNIQNTGQNEITSLDIEYSANGNTPETYTWTGNLASLTSETVELTDLTFSIEESNSLDFSIVNTDDNNANNTNLVEFDAVEGTGTVTMELNIDRYGDEVRWSLLNSAGDELYSGGPYGQYETVTETFQLPDVDCYTFDLQDTYGDGGTVATLTDSDGTELFYTNGTYGSGIEQNFGSNGVLGVGDNDFSGIAIYPNPANDILNIQNAENANIQVFDITGKLLLNKSNISNQEQLNVASFTTGTYFVKIMDGNKVQTQKLLIAR